MVRDIFPDICFLTYVLWAFVSPWLFCWPSPQNIVLYLYLLLFTMLQVSVFTFVVNWLPKFVDLSALRRESKMLYLAHNKYRQSINYSTQSDSSSGRRGCTRRDCILSFLWPYRHNAVFSLFSCAVLPGAHTNSKLTVQLILLQFIQLPPAPQTVSLVELPLSPPA